MLMHKLEDTSFSVYGIIFEKSQLPPLDLTPKLQRWIYEDMLLKVIYMLSFRGVDTCYMTMDKRGNRGHREKLTHSLKGSFLQKFPNLRLHIRHADSWQEKGIQLADIFAGAMRQEMQEGSSEWIALNQRRIREITTYKPRTGAT